MLNLLEKISKIKTHKNEVKIRSIILNGECFGGAENPERKKK